MSADMCCPRTKGEPVSDVYVGQTLMGERRSIAMTRNVTLQRIREIAVITVLAAAAPVFSADKLPVTADPKEAAKDPDFALQGEYVGSYSHTGGGDAAVGIQIIALGDGSFRAVGFEGGLPGAGWDGGDVHRAEGSRADDGSVTFVKEDSGARGVVDKDGRTFTVQAPDGTALGTLKKIMRESPTLGAAPPEGATVLFDGKSTEAWKDGARMTDDGLLMEGLDTVRNDFSHFTLHLEFRLPYKPKARGQARGNSGMYLLGTEVQMLDSFGLSGEANECGGIYNFRRPAVNMCLPPLSWQTYDVEYSAGRKGEDGAPDEPARMTVKHNGVTIHDNITLKNSPEKGNLHLQDHGNPVRYQNIWLVEK